MATLDKPQRSSGAMTHEPKVWQLFNGRQWEGASAIIRGGMTVQSRTPSFFCSNSEDTNSRIHISIQPLSGRSLSWSTEKDGSGWIQQRWSKIKSLWATPAGLMHRKVADGGFYSASIHGAGAINKSPLSRSFPLKKRDIQYIFFPTFLQAWRCSL